jgi:hypothetical protein
LDENSTSNTISTMTKPPDKKAEASQRYGTCHYYRADSCMRFPPQVITLGAFQSNSGQPYVSPIGFCGEWRAK